ncbi:Rv0361 family membrane protein [Nocardia crassostreae]|uniref:Rv0361 family membrane protein n=1 Tax=Nocardia crassostreae TaxID=53428 RepID=UPI000835A48C|nr:hypothetical protein [Nocardia crassostreae]
MSDSNDDQQPQGSADPTPGQAAEDTAAPAADATPSDVSPTAATEAIPATDAEPAATAATEVIRTDAAKPAPAQGNPQATQPNPAAKPGGSGTPGFATIKVEAPKPVGPAARLRPAGSGKPAPGATRPAPGRPDPKPDQNPSAAANADTARVDAAQASDHRPDQQPARGGQSDKPTVASGPARGEGQRPGQQSTGGGQSGTGGAAHPGGARPPAGEAQQASRTPSDTVGSDAKTAKISTARDGDASARQSGPGAGDRTDAPDAAATGEAGGTGVPTDSVTTQIIKIPGRDAGASGGGAPGDARDSGRPGGSPSGGQSGSAHPGSAQQGGRSGTQQPAAPGGGAAAEAAGVEDAGAQGDSGRPKDAGVRDGAPKSADSDGDAAASDAETVAMRQAPGADAPTTVFPVVSGEQATEKMWVQGTQGRGVSRPPQTPRANAGPRNVGPRGGSPQGPQGPEGPQGKADGVEETRPSPPPARPPMGPRRPASAPSPADMQPTMPANPIGGARVIGPKKAGPQKVGPGAPQGPGSAGPQKVGAGAPQGPAPSGLQKGAPGTPPGAGTQGPRPGGASAAGGQQGVQPPQPRPVAAPQRVPATGEQPAAAAPAAGAEGSKKKLLAIGAAVVAVLVIVGVVIGVVANRTDNSPSAQVKRAISTYTDALADGDLDALRGITCGAQHDLYQNISPEQFAGVYQTSKEQKSIPVVKSVDAISITGETAMASATVYTEADPAKQSARTFDLQQIDGAWKICDPANSAG